MHVVELIKSQLEWVGFCSTPAKSCSLWWGTIATFCIKFTIIQNKGYAYVYLLSYYGSATSTTSVLKDFPWCDTC